LRQHNSSKEDDKGSGSFRAVGLRGIRSPGSNKKIKREQSWDDSENERKSRRTEQSKSNASSSAYDKYNLSGSPKEIPRLS